MRQMRIVSVLLVLAIAGCASSKRPADIPRPDIDVFLGHTLFFGSGDTAAADVTVKITNRASVPLTVLRIVLDSPGMGQYAIDHTVHDYREVIAPGQTRQLLVPATATEIIADPTEPLTIRAVLDVTANGHTWREMVIRHG
jgi:hypothetical protein